jgi:hypothetical protein
VKRSDVWDSHFGLPSRQSIHRLRSSQTTQLTLFGTSIKTRNYQKTSGLFAPLPGDPPG